MNTPGQLKPQSISKLLGKPATLPGESAALYQASLMALVGELQATTVLQVYLAEKIHECLWWVRRYEAQKRATIVAEMAAITKVNFTPEVTAVKAVCAACLPVVTQKILTPWRKCSGA